jgi:hypothetical protein
MRQCATETEEQTVNAQAIQTRAPETNTQEPKATELVLVAPHIERVCWPEAGDSLAGQHAGTAIRVWLTMACVPAILAMVLTTVW